MKDKAKPIIITAVVIVAVVAMLYLLLTSNLFDTSGSFTKSLVGTDESERLTFAETAYVPQYQDVLDDWEQFKDEKIFFYCQISEIERQTSKHIDEYFCLVTLSEENTKHIKNLKNYSVDDYGRAIVPVLGKMDTRDLKDYNVGDYIYMYGYITGNEEYGEYSSVPVVDVRKVDLDLET